MAGKNRFGIGPVTETDPAPRRARDVGPMGAAVREAASNLQSSSEAMVEQRRQNATDAKEFRRAQDEGRVLVDLPLAAVLTDDLPRDRIDLETVAASDEMEELKTSIRARGQREPIEVYAAGEAVYQLKKGWRRLTALRQLFAETGDDRFAVVTARVAAGGAGRLDLYIDMVEENVIREDLTFAEMAQVAIDAAADPALGMDDAEALVGRLYASLHKMKRSYIRSFVALLLALDGDLLWPKAVARNLGADVARRLKDDADGVPGLRADLARAASPDAQAAILQRYLAGVSVERTAAKSPKREKFEFHVGGAKVTARAGECRIKSATDFSQLDRAVLERAVAAFNRIVEQS